LVTSLVTIEEVQEFLMSLAISLLILILLSLALL